MTTISRNTTGVLAAALLVALAGCAVAPQQPPVPAPAPTETTAEPAPEPTDAAPAVAPAQRFDVNCPDLLTRAQLDSLFGVNAVGLTYVELQDAIEYPAIPETYVVRQLGGMACEWSNGVDSNETTGQGAGYKGVTITFLPESVVEWDYYAGLYGIAGPRDLRCFSHTEVNCTLNSFVAGAWLEIAAHGMIPSTEAAARARFSPPVEGIEAALIAATVLPEVWSPPAGTLAMPSECAPLISNSAVATALGLPGAVVSESGAHGGWSLGAGAARMGGQSSCAWLFTDSDAGVGSMTWLPGGEWAWNELQDHVFTPAIGSLEALPVAGLAAGDSAFVRCSPTNSVCAADLIVGGNWINIYLWPDSYSPAIDRRTGIATMAAAVVDALR